MLPCKAQLAQLFGCLSQRRNLVLVAALTFMWTYLRMGSYANAAIVGAGEAATLFEIVYSAALLLVFLALLFVARLGTAVASPVVMRVLACAGIAGCALLARADALPSPTAWSIVGLTLSAAFVATMFVALGMWLAQCTPQEVIACTLCSYLLFRLLSLIQSACGFELSYLAPLVLATVSCALPAGPDRKQLNTSWRACMRATPWGLCALLVVFLFVSTVFLDVCTENSTIVSGEEFGRQLVSFPVSLLLVLGSLLLLCLYGHTRATFALITSIVLIVYSGIWLVVILFPDRYHLLASAKLFLTPFIWLMLACSASVQRVSARPSFAIFGILILPVMHSLSFGMVSQVGLLWGVAQLPGARWVAVGALGIVIVLAVAALLGHHAEQNRSARQQTGDAIDDLCRTATLPFGLSERELEVVTAVYRGHSAKMIAADLSLSPSTIRGNTLHAYRKMDIHSKQELIELIDRHKPS